MKFSGQHVFHFRGKRTLSNVTLTFQVIVTPMDQKLRDLRTLKQHYYPEVNIFLFDMGQSKENKKIRIKIEINTKN